jgi:methylated-DNA-protein-cysteine methyltransferase-like protein
MAHSNPPDPKAYASRVYAVVRAVPAGRVATYGQVAHLIPPPPSVPLETYLKLSPRWVGSAMAQCPDEVPWQRVINSQGKISERPGFGATVQRKLLEQEGVVFDEHDRVDLKRYGWRPEGEWLRAEGLVAPERNEDEGEQRALF